MRKQIFIVAALLVFGFASVRSASSQDDPTVSRTALSRMDVVSRAALFEQTIVEASRTQGVDPKILWTIAYNETRFRPWLRSPKNARGLMQFIPATATRFGLSDPYEPSASIRAAARYVKYLSGLFDGKLDSVLAAYNAGEGTVFAYLNGRTLLANGKRINATGKRTMNGVPPYRETTNYVANGRRIYSWLQAQGKFRLIDNPGLIATQDQTISIHANASESVGVAVLYDPRSGNRYIVDGRGKLQPIEQSGVVIVSPEVRSLPTQKARSTFAGFLP